MGEKFYVECGRCKEDVEFAIGEIDDLQEHIDNEVSGAESEARRETEKEFEDYVEADDLTGGERHLWELAAAIQRNSRTDANYHLDRLAERLGVKATEEVQQGRFSLAAQAA